MRKSSLLLSTTTDEILDLLRLFNDRAHKLYLFDFHRELVIPGGELVVEWKPGSAEARRKSATEEMKAAAVDLLRQLVDPQEKVSFEQMVGMHQRLPIPEYLKQRSGAGLEALNEYLRRGALIRLDDWTPTKGELFDIFVGGKYGEGDQVQIEKLNRLSAGPCPRMIEDMFEEILFEHIKLGLWYRGLNERIIAVLSSDAEMTRIAG